MSVTYNGDEYSEKAFQTAAAIVRNQVSSNSHPGVTNRGDINRWLGRQYQGERDIYDILGYPKENEIDEDDYRAKYERQDIANRVVELPANDTWRHDPIILDTESESQSAFERDIETLDQKHKLWHYARRLDIVSGIGQYGLLFLGLNDNKALDQEPNEGALSGLDDVAYMTPFAQDSVETWQLGKDKELEATHPRYNLPVEYTLDFGDIDDDNSEDWKDIHWKRVIHVAMNTVESDLKGRSRLKEVYNRLEDREKVIGASAEMFWTGAAPKYQFDIDADRTADIDDKELEQLENEVQALVMDMQQHIKTFNTDIEVIDGQEVDPTGVLEQIDQSIAGTKGIPKRILKGSEAAELASTQDRATWYGRMEQRRNRKAEPLIIRPLIDRLVELGIISEPNDDSYTVEWPNLFELTELEQTEVMMNRANALANAAPQGNTGFFGTPEEIYNFMHDGENPEFDGETGPTFEGGQEGQQSNIANATRYSEGDWVDSPDGKGIVAGVYEEGTVEGEDASSKSPVYTVALMDEETTSIFRASDLSKTDRPEIDVDDPVGTAAESPEANIKLETNEYMAVNDEVWNYPPSWRKSETPSRVILLDAWTSMGAQFDCGGGCCVGEMRGSVRDPQGFCASMKDRVLGTEQWRGWGA